MFYHCLFRFLLYNDRIERIAKNNRFLTVVKMKYRFLVHVDTLEKAVYAYIVYTTHSLIFREDRGRVNRRGEFLTMIGDPRFIQCQWRPRHVSMWVTQLRLGWVHMRKITSWQAYTYINTNCKESSLLYPHENVDFFFEECLKAMQPMKI